MRRVRRAGLNAAAIAVAVVTLFPIFWMVSTAFKPATEIFSLTPHPLPAHPTLGNFRSVIDGKVIGLPYWNFLRNSLLVTLASALAFILTIILLIITVGYVRASVREGALR